MKNSDSVSDGVSPFDGIGLEGLWNTENNSHRFGAPVSPDSRKAGSLSGSLLSRAPAGSGWSSRCGRVFSVVEDTPCHDYRLIYFSLSDLSTARAPADKGGSDSAGGSTRPLRRTRARIVSKSEYYQDADEDGYGGELTRRPVRHPKAMSRHRRL